MNPIKRIAILVIAVLFAFSNFSPAFASQAAQAGTVVVEFDNRTDENIRLALKGPESKTVTVEPGKNDIDLVPGSYTYSYSACGRDFSGKFQVTKSGAAVRLAHCKNGSYVGGFDGTPAVILENKTGESVTITLTGPQTYRFVVPPGSMRVEVKAGKYTYTHNACDIGGSGKLSTKTDYNLITFPKCRALGGGGNGGASVSDDEKLIVLLILNKMDAPFTLTLNGPQSYRFTIPVGRSKLMVAKGQYTWIVTSYACGGYDEDTGKLNLNGGIVWTWRCEQ